MWRAYSIALAGLVSIGTAAAADSGVLLIEGSPQSIVPIGQIGTRLVFWHTDAEAGQEPWITSGSAASTHRLTDLAPGTASSDCVGTGAGVVAHGGVYFSTQDPDNAVTWTDGTTVVSVPDVATTCRTLTRDVDGHVLFVAAYDHPNGFTSTAVFRIEAPGSPPERLAISPDGLYLAVVHHVADVGILVTSNSSDGSGSPLCLIRRDTGVVDCLNMPSPQVFSVVGDRVLVVEPSAPQEGIYAWSPNTGEVTQVSSIVPGGRNLQSVVNDRLVFGYGDAVAGSEPWVLDPTSGPHVLLDIVPGPSGSTAGTFQRHRDLVLFSVVHVPGFSRALWATDGTAVGTIPLTEPAGAGNQPIVYGDHFWLIADDVLASTPSNGSTRAQLRLHRLDGTTGLGSQLVMEAGGGQPAAGHGSALHLLSEGDGRVYVLHRVWGSPESTRHELRTTVLSVLTDGFE